MSFRPANLLRSINLYRVTCSSLTVHSIPTLPDFLNEWKHTFSAERYCHCKKSRNSKMFTLQETLGNEWEFFYVFSFVWKLALYLATLLVFIYDFSFSSFSLRGITSFMLFFSLHGLTSFMLFFSLLLTPPFQGHFRYFSSTFILHNRCIIKPILSHPLRHPLLLLSRSIQSFPNSFSLPIFSSQFLALNFSIS